MSNTDATPGHLVGPVLDTSADGLALARALAEGNPGSVVEDRGAYVRVLVPRRCLLTRVELERRTARVWRFPRDIERVMPSFKGFFRVTRDEACWSSERP
jgi:hypothetical protein